jgi:magnesium-transporting ATPase (P-type)
VPLLATQILWIKLVTDSGPALAMGVDPEIDDVMARRPRQRSDRILGVPGLRPLGRLRCYGLDGAVV